MHLTAMLEATPGTDPRRTDPRRTDPAGVPCRAGDGDLWFAESPAALEEAKARCAPCPLREACLAGALDRREPWGVWGGEILDGGAVIARKRPRGRPRKHRGGAVGVAS